jgi:TPR repeat protein
MNEASFREQTFSKLFHLTAEKYWQGRERSCDLIDEEGKAFLSSIGYTEDEFFAFIEDYVGVAKDPISECQVAADEGDASAQSRLGYHYANGLEVDRDYGQAILWYGKAAEQGDASAQSGLGYLYANGLGVNQDFAQAALWYGKAAEKGSEFSQLQLAYQYQFGKGISQDRVQAIHWFRQAANHGNAQAKEELRKLETPLLSGLID